MSAVRFPNESPEYRRARDQVVEAERDLRRRTESVAAMRRGLPLGGSPPEDYVLHAEGGRAVRLSELFAPGKDTLAIYGFMYGPEMARPCPLCTSILDSLDGAAEHLDQSINLAVVAKSPIERILAFAKERGWRRLRLLSSHGTHYNRDYHAEDESGAQLPMLNVFVRRDGAVRHFYATELFFQPAESGQDPRHVDAIWPLWNVLDVTPEGRGSFRPRLSYETVAR
jgi:predicted dithiol-disulfide oxidoreductase (DUF899 family)